MRNERPRTSPYRTIRLAVAMALGVIAVFALPSLAAAKDRNNDRIPDRWEKRHHLSLHVKQTRRDQDSDHLKNLGEFRHGTNPRKADSDNDGLDDGDEVAVGDNPGDDDTDNDGVEDGDENAGTVASFDGTILTIDLAAGGSISGQVTDQTEIECDDHGGEHHSGHEGSGSHSDRVGADEDGGEHQSGDDDGENGDHESGDDDGDNGDHETGDDAENGGSCSVDDLVQGANVHEAELHLGGSGAVFEKVELEPAAA